MSLIVDTPDPSVEAAEVKQVLGGDGAAAYPPGAPGIVDHAPLSGLCVYDVHVGVVCGGDHFAVDDGRRCDHPIPEPILPEGFAIGGVQGDESVLVAFRHIEPAVGDGGRGQRGRPQPARPNDFAGVSIQGGHQAGLKHDEHQPIGHRWRHSGNEPGVVPPRHRARGTVQRRDIAIFVGDVHPVSQDRRRRHDGSARHMGPQLRGCGSRGKIKRVARGQVGHASAGLGPIARRDSGPGIADPRGWVRRVGWQPGVSPQHPDDQAQQGQRDHGDADQPATQKVQADAS